MKRAVRASASSDSCNMMDQVHQQVSKEFDMSAIQAYPSRSSPRPSRRYPVEKWVSNDFDDDLDRNEQEVYSQGDEEDCAVNRYDAFVVRRRGQSLSSLCDSIERIRAVEVWDFKGDEDIDYEKSCR